MFGKPIATIYKVVGMPMKNISFQECVEFQDCFYSDGVFYPFDLLNDFNNYFPLAIIGEFGGMLDIACKRIRSNNLYNDQLFDECADIFIYLLLYGRLIEIRNNRFVLNNIKKNWNRKSNFIISDETLAARTAEFLCIIIDLLNQTHDSSPEIIFENIFEYIKAFNFYFNRKNWQETINRFHYFTVLKYTHPEAYTIDGWYKGSTQVNFSKLVTFVIRNEIEIPRKRIEFLNRMSEKQLANHSIIVPTIRIEGKPNKNNLTGISRNEFISQFPKVIPTGANKTVPDSLFEITQKFNSNINISRVIVFGSYAYGQPTPNSDVDILVIVDRKLSTKKVLLDILDIFRPRWFPLNLIVKTLLEINFAIENGDFFIKEILNNGVIIYEKNN